MIRHSGNYVPAKVRRHTVEVLHEGPDCDKHGKFTSNKAMGHPALLHAISMTLLTAECTNKPMNIRLDAAWSPYMLRPNVQTHSSLLNDALKDPQKVNENQQVNE